MNEPQLPKDDKITPFINRQIHEPLPMPGGLSTSDKYNLVHSDREDSSFGAMPYGTIEDYQERQNDRRVWPSSRDTLGSENEFGNLQKLGYMYGWSGRSDKQQQDYLALRDILNGKSRFTS